jgi:hypothetical protein
MKLEQATISCRQENSWSEEFTKVERSQGKEVDKSKHELNLKKCYKKKI